jgi:AcrR family transcriptional regulator
MTADTGKDGGHPRRLVPEAGSAAPEGLTDPVVGIPASKRALRSQGRKTMRTLLDAAMKVLDERGYHGTRVKDVVDLSNTSHGTFYLYFSNKEDLVRALTVEAASEASSLSTDTMIEAGGALDGESWAHLRGWIGDYSSLWLRYAPLFRSWTDLATMDEGVGDQMRRMITALCEAMATQITAAQPGGDLDPEVTSMAVLAMLDRFHYMRELVGRPVDEATLDTLTTMVHRALFSPVRSGGRSR